MTLKPIEVDIPMPEDEMEINAKFSELVVNLVLVSTFVSLLVGSCFYFSLNIQWSMDTYINF